MPGGQLFATGIVCEKGDRIANGRLHRTGLTLVSGPTLLAWP